MAYDDRGNALSTGGPSGQATYGDDADNRPITRTDATGSSSFSYDAAGRTTAVVDGLAGRTIDYTYDTGGRLAWTAERGLAQGVKRLRTYDALGRLGSDKVSESDPGGGARGSSSARSTPTTVTTTSPRKRRSRTTSGRRTATATTAPAG